MDSNEALETVEGHESEMEKKGKELKKFEGNMKKLRAIITKPNEHLLTGNKKAKKDDISAVIADMLKEDKEETATKVKTKLKALLTSYVLMNRELAKKKKELEQLELDKKKEFNKAAGELFADIDGLPDLEKEYHSALGAAATASSSEA